MKGSKSRIESWGSLLFREIEQEIESDRAAQDKEQEFESDGAVPDKEQKIESDRTAQDKEQDTKSSRLHSNSVLIMHNVSNYEIADKAHDCRNTALDVTIWGGDSYNCAEKSLSCLVQSQQECLRRLIYVPSRHKGGRMVRPRYCNGDRCSRMIFPSLTTLGYYEDCGTPFDAKWIVPNLETLYVFEDYRPMRDFWKVESGNDDSLPQRVLKECPNLVEIICAKPDFSKPFRVCYSYRLIRPQPIPWECLRLLEVAFRKEHQDSCPMAILSFDLVTKIVSFCHSPHWIRKDDV